MEIRKYQVECKQAQFDYFSSGNKGNPLVCLPTGTGKGFVISDFIATCLTHWPTTRAMMVTHDRGLVAQNYAKLQQVMPSLPVGIFSAGLNLRQMGMPVTFGTVKSIVQHLRKDTQSFGRIDVLAVDEAHFINPEEHTYYAFLIKTLKTLNPAMVVIGYTATPYRMKGGSILGAGIFTDIVYDLTDIAGFKRLINEGYLCRVIPKPTENKMQTQDLRIQSGDYSRADISRLITKMQYDICDEMVDMAADRNTWAIFTAGIEDSDAIADILQTKGIEAHSVHSKKSNKLNDELLEAYKNGDIQALVSADKLTTGFDHPPIDFIGMLRPTRSPALWVQMIGRGTRPSLETGKENCLVGDFAGNSEELGPINDPKIPGKRRRKGPGDMPVRICDKCTCYNHAAARVCEFCDAEFSFEIKLNSSASTAELLREDNYEEIIERFEIQYAVYNLHEKRSKEGELLTAPSVRISYWTDKGKQFNEWIHPESKRLRPIAEKWWFARLQQVLPETAAECLHYTSQIKPPKAIMVHTNKKYPTVKDYIW